MKVALVYDRVNKWGGAERLLLAIHEIFPKAPLYTGFYDSKKASWSKVFKIIPSFANKFPFAKDNHELYPWLAPLAFESFDFSQFDLVISVTSAEAKGIITKPETVHICYCLTPTRYLYSVGKNYFKGLQKLFFSPILFYLKAWDKIACFRPDAFISISETVQKRVKKYYKRSSSVIYPPVDTGKWKFSDKNKEDFYLVVSRLVKYKRIDLIVDAFNSLGKKLVIVGEGKEKATLLKKASGNIVFLGHLTDKELLGYYQKSKAVIFAQEEDFGLVPLEAQACGTPVIAFAKGGALETVVNRKTGLFFEKQTKRSLKEAVLEFESLKLYPRQCRENALRFDKQNFKKEFKSKILKKWKQETV